MISRAPKPGLPFFRKDRAIVLTSFKVMYSFFDRHPGFEKQFWNKRNMHLAALNAISGHPAISLFVRHPEARFLSYFRDKFRKEPQRRLDAHEKDLKPLQNCQKLWIKAHSKDGLGRRQQYEFLLRAQPGDVIAWLPTVRDLDVHTMGQVETLKARWRGFSLPLRPRHIYTIDRPEDVRLAGQRLGVSFAQKANVTDGIAGIELSDKAKARLRLIYQDDFALFDRVARQPPQDRPDALAGPAAEVST